MNSTSTTLPLGERLHLLVRVWRAWAFIRRHRHRPLPDLVRTLDEGARPHPSQVAPARLGRLVLRRLRLGPWQPVCLPRALVLYRLLREEGHRPALVIGLPPAPGDKDAHAWVEVDGVDVGPPPGRKAHVELVRYGGNARS